MGVKQMTYNLYISRSWNFNGAYNELEGLLRAINNSYGDKEDCFSVQLAPCSTYKGRQRYEQIRDKMRDCHAVVVLCGVYTSYSDWISKEIIASKNELNIPVIAIRMYPDRQVSTMIQKHADRIVERNAEQLFLAFKEFIDLPFI